MQVSVRHPAARSDVLAIVEATLQVRRGEVVAVIGPSGSGKTTLLQAMACALKPVRGEMTVLSQQPWALSRRRLHRLRGRLFLAPQVPPLPPRQRVVTAVLAGRLAQRGFWSSLRSLFYPIGIADARDALAHFDVAEKLFERVDRLSGGERQRVGLARALVSGAELMLVDDRDENLLAAVEQGSWACRLGRKKGLEVDDLVEKNIIPPKTLAAKQ